MSARNRRRTAGLAALLALLAAQPAGAAITYVASNSASSTTATLTITKPSGTTTNDVLIATVSGAGTTAISAPAGWTQIASTTSPASTMLTLTYFKVAGASEPSSYAFTSPGARNSSGGMLALRGANSNVPIGAVAAAAGASGNAVGAVGDHDVGQRMGGDLGGRRSQHDLHRGVGHHRALRPGRHEHEQRDGDGHPGRRRR